MLHPQQVVLLIQATSVLPGNKGSNNGQPMAIPMVLQCSGKQRAPGAMVVPT